MSDTSGQDPLAAVLAGVRMARTRLTKGGFPMSTNEQTSLVPVKREPPSLRTRALALADNSIRSMDVFRRYPAVSRAAAVGLGIGAGWQLSRVVRATQLDRPLVNLVRSLANGRNAADGASVTLIRRRFLFVASSKGKAQRNGP